MKLDHFEIFPGFNFLGPQDQRRYRSISKMLELCNRIIILNNLILQLRWPEDLKNAVSQNSIPQFRRKFRGTQLLMLFPMSLKLERAPEVKPEEPLRLALLSYWSFFWRQIKIQNKILKILKPEVPRLDRKCPLNSRFWAIRCIFENGLQFKTKFWNRKHPLPTGTILSSRTCFEDLY